MLALIAVKVYTYSQHNDSEFQWAFFFVVFDDFFLEVSHAITESLRFKIDKQTKKIENIHQPERKLK